MPQPITLLNTTFQIQLSKGSPAFLTEQVLRKVFGEDERLRAVQISPVTSIWQLTKKQLQVTLTPEFLIFNHVLPTPVSASDSNHPLQEFSDWVTDILWALDAALTLMDVLDYHIEVGYGTSNNILQALVRVPEGFTAQIVALELPHQTSIEEPWGSTILTVERVSQNLDGLKVGIHVSASNRAPEVIPEGTAYSRLETGVRAITTFGRRAQENLAHLINLE